MSLNQAIAVASLVFTAIAGTWAVSTYFSPKGEVEKANEKVEKAREEMAKKEETEKERRELRCIDKYTIEERSLHNELYSLRESAIDVELLSRCRINAVVNIRTKQRKEELQNRIEMIAGRHFVVTQKTLYDECAIEALSLSIDARQ